jgi:hypothetical protein
MIFPIFKGNCRVKRALNFDPSVLDSYGAVIRLSSGEKVNYRSCSIELTTAAGTPGKNEARTNLQVFPHQ